MPLPTASSVVERHEADDCGGTFLGCPVCLWERDEEEARRDRARCRRCGRGPLDTDGGCFVCDADLSDTELAETNYGYSFDIYERDDYEISMLVGPA